MVILCVIGLACIVINDVISLCSHDVVDKYKFEATRKVSKVSG